MMRTLQRFFIDTSNILETEFNRSSSVKHTGLKGQDREMFIQKFLEKTFPKKFVIGTGEILDSNDNRSKQADIVVYDEFMPTFDYGTTKHFLSGGVLAHIEVKSYLDSNELVKALDVTKSIKDLNRDIDSGLSVGPIMSTKIPSFIFAYKGITKKNFKKTFTTYYKNEKNIDNYVDGVCVLNKYTTRNAFQNNKPPKKIAFLETKEDSLMVFFESLFSQMYKNWLGFPQLLKYLGNHTYKIF